MKLLGIRICEHDSNFSYFDGNKVHYLKTERKYQIKHHGVKNLHIWKDIIYEQWGIQTKDLNEIAIVFDPWSYNLNSREENFFPSKHIDFPIDCRITRVNHHYAHHLSCWPLIKNPAFYNGICIDGFGDYDKAWTVFVNNEIKEEGSSMKNGSIGMHMSLMRNHFNLQGDHLDIAGKIMSLQSFGNIDHDYLKFLSKFSIRDVNFIFNHTYYIDKWQDKLNWLRTIHEYVGVIILQHLFENFKKEETFLYTGGVALNVCWNTKIKSFFKNVIIPPHTNDEGLSLGALEFLRLKHNLPQFKIDNFPFCQSDESPVNEPSQQVYNKVAELLTKQNIIGWYQGHGEIGPRALGHRSILADPRDKDMRDKVNLIKKREDFRPFGCSTIDEDFNDSDFMLFADRINTQEYPAVSHIDNTTRHQKVNQSNGLHTLLHDFKRLTNCGTLLNTSLNINGKPLASSKKDAMQLLQNSSLDGLVYGNELYLKNG